MALAVASSTQTTPNDLLVHTVTAPAGITDGDLLVVCGSLDPDGALSDLTGPAGWVVAHSGGAGPPTAPAQAGYFKVWTRTAASEPASWGFGGNPTSSGQFTALRVTGAGTAPVAVRASGGTLTKATTHLAPSVAGTAGHLLVCGWQIIPESTASTFVAQGSMTQHGTAGSVSGTWLRHLVASELLSATGATGTRTMTTSITPATYGDSTWSLTIGELPAPVITETVSVEWVPGSGTFVSLGSRVQSASVNHPRSNPLKGIDASPTVLTAVIKNYPDTTGFCPFTPGSPTAARYPNVTRDRRVKLEATVNGVTYTRFLGWSDAWVPDTPDGNPASSVVTLTASCVLSRYARRSVRSLYGEILLNTPGIPGHDYYPFDEPTDSTTVQGYSSDGVTVIPGQVIIPNRPPGSASFQSPDGGHLADGQIEFTRGDDNTPAPVVLLTLRPGMLVGAISASFRLATDPAGALGDDMISAYNAAGERLWVWSVKVAAGLVTWALYDDSTTNKTFYGTGAPRDDAWHFWQLRFTSSFSAASVGEKGGATLTFGSAAWTYDPRPVRYLVVGGQMPPFRKGKQTNTFQGSVSSLLVQYTTSGGLYYGEFIVPNVVTTAGRAATFINYSNIPLDTLAGGSYGTLGSSSDLTPVAYTNGTTDQLERWNEHVRTVGGSIATHPDGRRYFLRAVDENPTTPALVLDANLDLDMGAAGWQQILDEVPTRQSASGPLGSVTVVDTATETLTGIRLDGPGLQLAAGSSTVAASAAAASLASKGARVSFGVDATLTSTDKTIALFSLAPGDRIRVQNLPTALMGISAQDVYASGWTETYIGEFGLVQFVFDADPADDPPEGVFDSAALGRFAVGDGAATVTGGTCVGTTGTGTLIVTSTSPLTNTGGEFPLDLSWNGERVTVSGVGGATSPQTFTVTARGVAPSVARVHATGEALEIYKPLTFGF
jgi:hypothetical protein